jgi:hypothetical protein
VSTTEDTGEIDPRLSEALKSGDDAAIRAAMLDARLLVPIVAMGEESAGAEMAVPSIVNPDGLAALPVFSCYEALRRWRADARPVPMPGRQAVSAAIDEGYAAVVLDVAGPIAHVAELRSAHHEGRDLD